MATLDRSHDEAARLQAVRRYAILETPPDGAFDRVCALAARFFKVPVATVTIVDENRIWFKAHEGLEVSEVPREPGLCASAILQDDAYVVTDGLSDQRTAANALVAGAPGVRFYAAAPIVTSDGHRLGTVNVIDMQPREVTDGEIATLHDLAAIVMDELELRLAASREVRREREARQQALRGKRIAESLAQTLQRSLSPPSLPQIDGLDLASHYQPVAPEQVGGDFYDVFPLGSDRSGFFLGDVCGKGPDAASLTSLARYTLRTAAMLQEEPNAVLRDLNQALLLGSADELAMCTAIYGQARRTADSTELSLAVGGHPSPLIIRAGGELEAVGARGTVLGAVPDMTARTVTEHLGDGDTIVLYSDGLLDVAVEGTRMDELRLGEVLAAGGPLASAAEAVERLRCVLEQIDRPLRDDVAILALRATR